jgi:hypothetical protein
MDVLEKRKISFLPEILTADHPALKGVEPHWELSHIEIQVTDNS